LDKKNWIRKIEGKDIVYLSVKSTSGKGGLPNDAAIATYGPQSPNSRPASHSDANSVSGQVIAAEDRYTQAYLHRDWADLNEALAWGRKAVVACRAPVEVRPFL